MSKSLSYASRAEQMRAFARRFQSGEASIHEVLKDACICGAAEERFHALNILRNGGTMQDICKTPVDEVCGYGAAQGRVDSILDDFEANFEKRMSQEITLEEYRAATKQPEPSEGNDERQID